MEETTEHLMTGAAGANVAAADPDKTLVQPRFDVREEQTAQPVVPLAQPGERGGRLRSSSLPVVLILVSAVVGGLVSVLAYRAYQRPTQPAAAQESQQQPQTPAAEASAEQSPTPELVVVEEVDAPPAARQPSEETETEVAATVAPDAAAAAREERAVVKEDRKPAATAAPERAPRRTDDDARPERSRDEPARARRVDVITGPTGERVSRRERGRDDSEIEGDATDYESRAERRGRRRAARRSGRRNVDRVRAIFEGDPPRLD